MFVAEMIAQTGFRNTLLNACKLLLNQKKELVKQQIT